MAAQAAAAAPLTIPLADFNISNAASWQPTLEKTQRINAAFQDVELLQKEAKDGKLMETYAKASDFKAPEKVSEKVTASLAEVLTFQEQVRTETATRKQAIEAMQAEVTSEDQTIYGNQLRQLRKEATTNVKAKTDSLAKIVSPGNNGTSGGRRETLREIGCSDDKKDPDAEILKAREQRVDARVVELIGMGKRMVSSAPYRARYDKLCSVDITVQQQASVKAAELERDAIKRQQDLKQDLANTKAGYNTLVNAWTAAMPVTLEKKTKVQNAFNELKKCLEEYDEARVNEQTPKLRCEKLKPVLDAKEDECARTDVEVEKLVAAHTKLNQDLADSAKDLEAARDSAAKAAAAHVAPTARESAHVNLAAAELATLAIEENSKQLTFTENKKETKVGDLEKTKVDRALDSISLDMRCDELLDEIEDWDTKIKATKQTNTQLVALKASAEQGLARDQEIEKWGPTLGVTTLREEAKQEALAAFGELVLFATGAAAPPQPQPSSASSAAGASSATAGAAGAGEHDEAIVDQSLVNANKEIANLKKIVDELREMMVDMQQDQRRAASPASLLSWTRT